MAPLGGERRLKTAEPGRVTDQSSDVLLISHIRGWRTGGGEKVSMRRVREGGRERGKKRKERDTVPLPSSASSGT